MYIHMDALLSIATTALFCQYTVANRFWREVRMHGRARGAGSEGGGAGGTFIYNTEQLSYIVRSYWNRLS